MSVRLRLRPPQSAKAISLISICVLPHRVRATEWRHRAISDQVCPTELLRSRSITLTRQASKSASRETQKTILYIAVLESCYRFQSQSPTRARDRVNPMYLTGYWPYREETIRHSPFAIPRFRSKGCMHATPWHPQASAEGGKLQPQERQHSGRPSRRPSRPCPLTQVCSSDQDMEAHAMARHANPCSHPKWRQAY